MTSAIVEHIMDEPDVFGEARPTKDVSKAMYQKLSELVASKGCEVKSRRIPAV